MKPHLEHDFARVLRETSVPVGEPHKEDTEERKRGKREEG